MRPSDAFYRALRLSSIAESLTRARRGIDAVRAEMSRAGREPRPQLDGGFLRRCRDESELEQALVLTESEFASDRGRLLAMLRRRGATPDPLPGVAPPADGTASASLESRCRALEARVAAHVEQAELLRSDPPLAGAGPHPSRDSRL